MPDPFNSPASGQFRAKDFNGRLLIVTPNEYVTGINTVNGVKDAVDAKVVVVDETNPAGSEVIEGARLFGGQLIAGTKPFIGKGMVLGRLGQGTAKPGQNAPWVLNDPTDEDRTKAQAYLSTTAPQI